MTVRKIRTVSSTEVQTMRYLSKRGYSNCKIAGLMGFNESTVRKHLSSTTIKTSVQETASELD